MPDLTPSAVEDDTSDSLIHADRLIVFFIPFFIIRSLKLRQRQKFGLIGVFSLGLITMAISFARFMIYTVSDYDLSDNDGGKANTLLVRKRQC